MGEGKGVPEKVGPEGRKYVSKKTTKESEKPYRKNETTKLQQPKELPNGNNEITLHTEGFITHQKGNNT